MADRTYQPSMKPVWAAFFLTLVLFLAAEYGVYRYGSDWPRWLYFVPLVFLLQPMRMYLGRSLVSLRFHYGHLTLETGFFSRTRRTLDIAKIQDVTVRQTLGQRIMATGDLVLESAGENGTMMMLNVDNPRELADAIIAGSRGGVNRF